MQKCRYEVMSEYGAWAPDPEAVNRIIDAVNAATSLNGSDCNPEKVQAVLNEKASAEVQAKYKLKVRANPGKYGVVPLPVPEYYDPVYDR